MTLADRDAERRARAEARRGRAFVRRGALEAVVDDPAPVRGEAALSLVTVLTREGWSEAGWTIPTYDRAHTPCRFVPRGST